MKYIGFCERLIITPLTDKYFLSISSAMNNASIPFISSPHHDGCSGKRAMITCLASELGVDHYHVDCSSRTMMSSSPQLFFDVIKAQISAGLWLTFNHVESFLPPMLSICFTVLSSLTTALHSKATYFMLAGEKIDFIPHPSSNNNNSNNNNSNSNSSSLPFTQPRTVLLYSTNRNSIIEPFSLPVSARQQFRPIIYIPPSYSILIETFLTVYNFHNVPMLSSRLITLSDYVINYNIAPLSLVYSLLFRCIKDIGSRYNYKDVGNNKTNTINYQGNTFTTSTTTGGGGGKGGGGGNSSSSIAKSSSNNNNQGNSSSSNTPIIELLVKGFFTSLPTSSIQQSSISDQHYRFISNLCLDVLFIKENDLKDFQPTIPTADNYQACADYLCNSLRQTQYSCILVIGAANTGTSLVIITIILITIILITIILIRIQVSLH